MIRKKTTILVALLATFFFNLNSTERTLFPWMRFCSRPTKAMFFPLNN